MLFSPLKLAVRGITSGLPAILELSNSFYVRGQGALTHWAMPRNLGGLPQPRRDGYKISWHLSPFLSRCSRCSVFWVIFRFLPRLVGGHLCVLRSRACSC